MRQIIFWLYVVTVICGMAELFYRLAKIEGIL